MVLQCWQTQKHLLVEPPAVSRWSTEFLATEKYTATDIASTRSSTAANAVATVIQTFQLSTNFLRRVTIGCFTNSVDIYYITFSHHPPQHHNTTTSAVHQQITDSYQHAQATSPTATSSHAYCTKIVTELLSQWLFTPISLGVCLLYCVLSLLILKKWMNEWMICLRLDILTKPKRERRTDRQTDGHTDISRRLDRPLAAIHSIMRVQTRERATSGSTLSERYSTV